MATLRPDPNDPSLSPEQLSEPPVPAVALSHSELQRLGLLPSDASTADHPSHADDKIGAFVNRVYPAASRAASELRVPVEAVISQWALESGWGQSKLASEYNNLGGIKAFANWKGQKVDMPTYEKDRTERLSQPFRVYPSLDDYAADYVAILSNPRYTLARGTNTVSDFGTALTKAGYSQDSVDSYRGQLESIAKRIAPILAAQK